MSIRNIGCKFARTAGLATFLAPCIVLATPQAVASFTRVKNAKVKGVDENAFSSAQTGQRISSRDTVRTGRRAFAEITFTDRSLLRVNENTDMVIFQGDFLRKMQLQKGAVWMKVAKGTSTAVETPVATATVRGTEFEYAANGDLKVFEGEVWLEAAGSTLMVMAGESAEIGPDGKPRKLPQFTLFYDPQPAPPELLPWWDPQTWDSDDPKFDYVQVVFPVATLALWGRAPHGERNAIPEPSSALVLALGAGLSLRGRNRNR